MLNNNKISGIYILTNPVIYKWPNRFVYMSSIWVRTKSYLRRCCEMLPEVTWPEVTSVMCPVRKYVLRMHNRKLRHIRPSGAFLTGSDNVTWPKGPCPELALTGSRFCACPVFLPSFFSLSSSNMTTGCDLRSFEPFGVPLGVRMRNRKLRNTRSDRRLRDPFGSVLWVFSTTSASYI